MISTLPTFRIGFEYRELPSGRYRYVTKQAMVVKFDTPLKETISFNDKNGIEWARLHKGKLWIRSTYTWNGNSPGNRLGSLWVGTPNPPCTHLASLVHDALYQFRHTTHFPFSREQCDEAFYDLMKLSGFQFPGLYHAAVRLLGGVWSRRDDAGVWSRVVPPVLPQSNSDAA